MGKNEVVELQCSTQGEGVERWIDDESKGQRRMDEKIRE